MGLVTCSDVYDRCTNTTVEVYVKTMDESLIGYELGCGKEEECQQKRCPRHFGIDIPGSKKYKNCQISCCSGDLCPLPPNSTIRPPKAGPEKGARGGVGRVTLWPWYSFGELLLWTVFSKLFGVVWLQVAWGQVWSNSRHLFNYYYNGDYSYILELDELRFDIENLKWNNRRCNLGLYMIQYID